MSATDNHSGDARKPADVPSGWLDMSPADFDTALPVTQGALFPEPDRYGTEPMFGGLFGDEL
jgi:hypothetical protein